MTSVTILVAVYNAEKYLSKCLDSLLRQTLTDWQAICIDDASTDGSLAILRRYEECDKRFRVIHLNENRGQAHARNQGLLFAEGEYTCFLDSDDWLADDALEKTVEVFRNNPKTDCVLFDCQYVDERTGGKSPYSMQPFECKSGREAFVDSLTWKIHGVYMVRTSIHIKHPYDESAKSYSDDNTTRVHYFVSDEVRLGKGTYFYLQRQDSVTHKNDFSRVNCLRANESMAETLERLGCDEEIKALYEHQRWLTLVDTYYFYYRNKCRFFSSTQRRNFLDEIHKYWGRIEVGEDKFGFRHCSSWAKFRLQEELYFTLKAIRALFSKNK